MKYALIHLSDIHFRKNHAEGVSNILNLFLEDLNQQINNNEEYYPYLAITGDIVYEGADSNAYEVFFKEMNERLDQIGITKDRRIQVPGNHDVDRNIVLNNYEMLFNNREEINTEECFNNFIEKNDIFNDMFANYELFETDFSKYGLDFFVSGKGWEIDKYLGVYCLNSAICSLGGVNNVKDENKLSICTRELMEWCKNKKTSLNIILMHHPLKDLTKWSRDEIKKIIDKNFILCLSGHNHEQDVFFTNLTQNSLVCSAPQLFTSKSDYLGYAIIYIENTYVSKIVYRQYINNQFLNGAYFTNSNDGILQVPAKYAYIKYQDNIALLQAKLENSLLLFKGQPHIFIKPIISRKREFNDDENILDDLIASPTSSFIVAHPQFGLTCLSHYMRLEAYKNNSFWIYIDSFHCKSRKILKEIEEQCLQYGKRTQDIDCIIVDSWDSNEVDHQHLLLEIDAKYQDVPLIIMMAYSEFIIELDIDMLKLLHKFEIFHLQALKREKVREFIATYNAHKKIAEENEIVSKIVKDMKALNIHRTPLNCYTLLRVLENNFNENMINRTKLIKAVLNTLFSDVTNIYYSSKKPDIDDVEFIMGYFCKNLIINKKKTFSKMELTDELMKFTKTKLITIDVKKVIAVFIENNIILNYNENYEFKHTYWIFYFAGSYMFKDEEFANYVIEEKRYVNYPEIIEFYTGIDGRRENIINVLIKELMEMINCVSSKIGIPDDYNPWGSIVWEPNDKTIENIRNEISEKVQNSNLPNNIKDQHADRNYNSEAPYSQTINHFLNEYSVISLFQCIKASSGALRNSNYINPDYKITLLSEIIKGWEQLSRIFLWISPVLAIKGKASYDGIGVELSDSFKGTAKEKLKEIFLLNPKNTVGYFKDYISSNKIGPAFYKLLNSDINELQKHFIALYLISEKPTEWCKNVHSHMNKLHISTFYIGDINIAISEELQTGYLDKDEEMSMKNLKLIVKAKINYSPRGKAKPVPESMRLSKDNELEIDKINAASKSKMYKPVK